MCWQLYQHPTKMQQFKSKKLVSQPHIQHEGECPMNTRLMHMRSLPKSLDKFLPNLTLYLSHFWIGMTENITSLHISINKDVIKRNKIINNMSHKESPVPDIKDGLWSQEHYELPRSIYKLSNVSNTNAHLYTGYHELLTRSLKCQGHPQARHSVKNHMSFINTVLYMNETKESVIYWV